MRRCFFCGKDTDNVTTTTDGHPLCYFHSEQQKGFNPNLKPMLSAYRQAQIRTFCNYLFSGFPNVSQAGKYALKILTIAGDGGNERRAILAELWDYHKRLVCLEIPF